MADDQQQRELNPLGFYSHAAEMASQLPQERGSPQQMASMLTNKYGVKPVEMEGFDEAFAGQPSVTRDQLVQHFTSNMPQIERKVLGGSEEFYPDSEPTKFSKYALPGGENYREVLLKTPDQSGALRKETAEAKSLRTQAVDDYANAAPGSPEAVEAQERIKKYTKIHTDLISKNTNLPPEFRSSHWDEPNVLAHIRLSDRTGPSNEKILHIEEIQSDWAQKGRKVGFADRSQDWAQKYADFQKKAVADWIEKKSRDVFEQNPTLFGSLDKSREMAQIAAKHYGMAGIAEDLGLSDVHKNLYEKMDQFRNGVSSAPYVTNTAAWTDLALKHVLHEAAHGDYDKVVWTPGAEQAKRYDLSKQIGALHLEDGPRGEQMLRAYGPSGDHIINKHIIDAEKELPDLIGKEAAEKLLSQTPAPARLNQGPTRSLTGLDLQTGGEGMKGYYDKIVPTQLSKLLKKLDPEAKIEAHNLDTRSPADKKMGLPEGQSINTVRAQSIRITPKMRESIKRGLPTYADGGAVDDEDDGITAYHGSPHDFEQFDTSEIGTGAGAQAYGHGLYFAESEPVAKNYRNSIAGSKLEIDGQSFPDYYLASKGIGQEKILTGAVQNILKMMHQEHLGLDEAVSQVKHDYSSFGPEHLERVDRAADFLRQKNAKVTSPGRMYEVRINAHPDHFLDWDAPILDQPEVYSRIIQAVKDKASSSTKNKDAWVALAQEVGERGDETFGQHLHNALVRPSGAGLSAKEASDFLSNAGVSGIKYLDAGSRDKADKRTQNYVVFNHDHVQVKRKYAQGGAIDET